jgi:predicted aconitase/predicted aconitase with swiveling domain
MDIEQRAPQGRSIVGGEANGEILALGEGISFWGGIDPDTGRVIDVHHPSHGVSLAGKILMMPTSRGSCSGSGVLLELSLNRHAPAALIFCEREEILTLGALVSDRIFGQPLPVVRLARDTYDRLARVPEARLAYGRIMAPGLSIDLNCVGTEGVELTEQDRAILRGEAGLAAKQAMEVICLMAAADDVDRLTAVTRGHIDGCILAHSANLIFAEKMAELGARVTIPTTINAISVDRENWHRQGVDPDFGTRASRLADAYVRMGAKPVFTCAPYLLENPPIEGEVIGWSESNAVIFANTVLGARTPKHPDYLDLFIAMTGKAPLSGVYTEAGRKARVILDVSLDAQTVDDQFWPLLGWIAGRHAPDRIPLIRGVAAFGPTKDDLKALCAAFGTTSGAPMLHIEGVTPEAHLPAYAGALQKPILASDFAAAWRELNRGAAKIDLVSIGSPHASAAELRQMVTLFAGRLRHPATEVIVTVGRDVLSAATRDGTVERLQAAGVRLLPDLCWCSIVEPVFPPEAQGIMTNSGKYAHYAHGLSGRHARLGSLSDCVEAALTGAAPAGPPDWLTAAQGL